VRRSVNPAATQGGQNRGGSEVSSALGDIPSPCPPVRKLLSLVYVTSTSLHVSLPYISTCVPSIHLYMRPFHTSLHASLPYISTCVPSIHVGIVFPRPPFLTLRSDKKDPNIDSKDTPSCSDTPSIRSYSLKSSVSPSHEGRLKFGKPQPRRPRKPSWLGLTELSCNAAESEAWWWWWWCGGGVVLARCFSP